MELSITGKQKSSNINFFSKNMADDSGVECWDSPTKHPRKKNGKCLKCGGGILSPTFGKICANCFFDRVSCDKLNRNHKQNQN